MAREYDPDIENMLRLTNEQPSHMSAQFDKQPREMQFRRGTHHEPVRFDIRSREDFPGPGERDVEVGDNRIRIGQRSYGGYRVPHFHQDRADFAIPTESGWHAMVAHDPEAHNPYAVWPVYHGDYTGRHGERMFTGESMSLDNPQHWAEIRNNMGQQESGPDVRGAIIGLSEQGMQRAIDSIGHLPRPQGFGHPRRIEALHREHQPNEYYEVADYQHPGGEIEDPELYGGRGR